MEDRHASARTRIRFLQDGTMEFWISSYNDARAGLATQKSLEFLNSHDVFEEVEKKVRNLGSNSVGNKRRREDADFIKKLHQTLSWHQTAIEVLLENALENFPCGLEKLKKLPVLPSRTAVVEEDDDEFVLK